MKKNMRKRTRLIQALSAAVLALLLAALPAFVPGLPGAADAYAGRMAGKGHVYRGAESGPGVSEAEGGGTAAAAETEAAATEDTASAAQGPAGNAAPENTAGGDSGAAAAASGTAAGTSGGSTPAATALAASVSSGVPGRITLLAVGDNLIHTAIYRKAFRPDTGTYDFNPMYDPLRELISAYDLAVINQETIFVSDYSLLSDYPCFGTPVDMGDAIVNAGFDIVLSATNHTMDKGLRGLTDTLAYWKTFHPEITLLGLHETPEDFNTIDYVERNGIKLALFNYTYGLNGFSVPASAPYMVDLLARKDKLMNDLRTAEQEADMSVCFLHIGEEYVYQPTAYQTAYINDLIDCGADLVICAHPHVVEPCRTVTTPAGNTGLVYYSCGNFLSSQTRIPRILGGIASVTIEKDENGTRIADYAFIPEVNHYNGVQQFVCLLDDYTDALAATHHVYFNDAHFDTASLRNLWHSITGL